MTSLLHQSVIGAFYPFTSKYEGVIYWMYLDVKGLVTTGLGYLIDSVEAAAMLPWKKPDGSDASVEEIEAEWLWVKNDRELAVRGAGLAKSVTKLRLLPEDVERITDERLEVFVEKLVESFPEFADMPADAQLGLCSMAWAMGPGFAKKFPRFTAHVRAGDFKSAAEECAINSAGNPGVVPRNRANKQLFLNAAKVAASCGDITQLTWVTEPA